MQHMQGIKYINQTTSQLCITWASKRETVGSGAARSASVSRQEARFGGDTSLRRADAGISCVSIASSLTVPIRCEAVANLDFIGAGDEGLGSLTRSAIDRGLLLEL